MAQKKRGCYYNNLQSDYSNPDSLSSKKILTLDSYIKGGHCLLDVGMGTGELVELEIEKFDKIYGIDVDSESVNICKERFKNKKHVEIAQGDITRIDSDIQFDYITACDVLEHVEINETKKILQNIHSLLDDNGVFIFTGPGIFEKIKIFMGKSEDDHKHSHSSYGWSNIFNSAGFEVVSIETIEFPILDKEILRKKIHLFGKCCLIVCKKRGQ